MRKAPARRFYSQGLTKGFTLVELLVVISLIGILAGVTISIINPKKQRQVAEDGIRQANLQKYALGIEAYGTANGSYPTDANGDGEPEGADLATFISKIPKDEPTVGVTYPYTVVADPPSFGVFVVKASDSNACFKYRSTWGRIRECVSPNCVGDTDAC